MTPQLDVAAYLGHQRWFAGKGRSWRLAGVATLGHLQEAANGRPQVRIDIATIAYDDGDTESYQLPLVSYDWPVGHLEHARVGEESGPEGQVRYVYDAMHDKDSTGLWVQGIAESRSSEGWSFHREPTAAALPPGGPSIVVGVEQSNTSVIFGDTIIIKAFRKVSAGLNPDIEVHSALAAAGSTHIARPLGWLEGCWPDPAGVRITASLAMAQDFLRDATDGWMLALTSVRDLYAEADLHADEVGGDFAGEARRLGAATAEVHDALARALPTAILDRKELAALAEGMRDRLDRAVAVVPELEPFVDSMRAAFADVAELVEPVQVQRVHGDFHLGQVMRTLDGWKLLDFEGEPARSLEERRALHPPMKDIAGMLRSFDYAARHLLADRPPDLQLEYRAAEWAARNRAAFSDGYARAGGWHPAEQPVLLRAFEADKVVYEVLYEARNRPTWLQIPIAAIRRLSAPEE